MRPDLCVGHASPVEGLMRPGVSDTQRLLECVPTDSGQESERVCSSGRSACDHPARLLAPSAFCLLSTCRLTQQHHVFSVYLFQQKELP